MTRQREDARKLAKLRRWTVVREETDNDTSAAGRRKREGFEAILAALESGEADAVIAWDMTRLTRNRRDTLRLVEIGERVGAKLAFVRGSDLDLSTPAGQLTADILAGVARHEIAQKSDRQRRAVLQAAQAGKRVGGRRPFGYQADGIKPNRKEAAAIRKAYAAVLAGVPLGRIARDLNAAGLHTPQLTRIVRDADGTVIGGGEPSKWTAQTVRPMLLNPRYAGLRAHGKGRAREIFGRAEWPGIVDEATWRAACAVIDDPRRASPAREGRGLLTGLGLCGVCGSTVHRGGAAKGAGPTYRCRASLGHLGRRAAPVDEYVAAVVVERLSRPDARDLLHDQERPDVDALRTEANALQARLAELAELHVDGTITTSQLRAGTERARSRLQAVESALTAAGRVNVLGPLLAAAAGDVRTAWDRLDTERQRAIVDTLMVVRVLPPGRGTRTFRPDTVEILWKQAA